MISQLLQKIAFPLFIFSMIALPEALAVDRDKVNKNAPTVSLRKKNKVPEREYVQHWVRFPTISGKSLDANEKVAIKPNPGKAMVVYFIASYDIGSQNLISRFKNLQNKYDERFTDFVYVFLNDLQSEAQAFVKDKKLHGTIVLGDSETKKAFRFPPLNLPIVFVADRKGWLTSFYNRASEESIIDLDKFLALITDV